MIRPTIACLLAVILAGLGLAADDPKPAVPDEPPAVLKKKKKTEPTPDEKPAPKKDGEPKPKLRPKDEDGEPKEEAPDPKEVLERITKNIRAAEERLRKKDAGDGTRQVQRDVVKDIDKLIERMQQQQQNPQGGGNSSSSSADKNDGQQQQSSSSSKSRRGERERRTKSDSKADSQATPDARNSMGGNDRDRAGAATPTADILKDIWGHLPTVMRLEMDAYSREQFAVKYGELLKQYYQTIAEKGRRTENER